MGIWLAISFSLAVLREMMAQLGFPLCRYFPAISSKSYVVANYALNMQFTPFCQAGVDLSVAPR